MHAFPGDIRNSMCAFQTIEVSKLTAALSGLSISFLGDLQEEAMPILRFLIASLFCRIRGST
jgi:hypothetical protein